MSFSSPYLLLLLIPAWVLLFWLFRLKTKHHAAGVPSLTVVKALGSTSERLLAMVPIVLRILAVTMTIIAIAKPYILTGKSVRAGQGLNIMMAIDVSGSMRALDFEYQGERMDRLQVVKRVVEDFVATRGDDRLGMVVFGTEAFTQVPLTLDHEAFISFLEQVHIAQAGPRTAIGDGLALSLKRLLDVDDKSKMVILLTDGVNNSGNVEPLEAAHMAKTLGIPIYTIGVATHGQAPFLENHPLFGQRIVYHESDIDEDILQEISRLTGGEFYRAVDSEGLKAIYDDIDQRETSRFEITTFNERVEVFSWFVWPGIALLVLEMFMIASRWWRLP